MPGNEEMEKVVFRLKKISNQFKFPEDLNPQIITAILLISIHWAF